MTEKRFISGKPSIKRQHRFWSTGGRADLGAATATGRNKILTDSRQPELLLLLQVDQVLVEVVPEVHVVQPPVPPGQVEPNHDAVEKSKLG